MITVSVTLRYLSKMLISKSEEKELPDGCSAGELCSLIISEEEKKENISFSGASIVTLVNGRVVTPDHILKHADVVKIMPVAAAG